MADRNSGLPRREFLVALGVAAPTLVSAQTAERKAADVSPRAGPPASESPATATRAAPTCLSPSEWAFVVAAADAMIPADDLSPSGSELGIPGFIDRQLGGDFGSGARTYRLGPFFKGTPQQGYQLPLSPREFFALGIRSVNAHCLAAQGKEFDRLSVAQRNAVLTDLDQKKIELADIVAGDFMDALLTIVMEGFFSDPVHGGNRNAASWAMIGFPGLPAFYANDMLDFRGRPYPVSPQSILDQS